MIRRMLVRGALIAAGAAVGLLGWAGPASAHATLLVTAPLADGAVSESPAHVELVFNEVAVLDTVGRRYRLGAAAAGAQGRAVRLPVETALPTGVYTVRWEVTGVDGDRVGDQFRFAVGAAVVAPGVSSGDGLGVGWGSAGLRWLLLAALAVGLGGLVGQRLVADARAVNPQLPEIRSWLPAAALVGAAAAAGLAVPLLDRLLDSTPGRVALAELVGFAAAAGMAAVRRAVWAALPMLLVVAAEGFRSHAQLTQPGWGAVLTAVHLGTASVWVGALLHAVRAGWAWRGRWAAVWWLVGGYARWGLWLAGGVLAAGAGLALLLVPPDQLATTWYGRTLLLKLALVTTAVTLAGLGRRWLGRRRDPGSLARTATAEVGVLGLVLAVSAALTASPTAGAETPNPPAPPVGVVQPVGALAGQLGLAIAASEGQLVVRASTPRLGDYYEVPAAQTYRLAGRLVPAGGDPVTLEFRGCGEDCFVAAAGWARGDNLLTLRAGARGWRGGDASVLVPWPVTPLEAPVLPRVVQAMRQAGAFTVMESVTSDTGAPMPAPQPLPVVAEVFLASQPYGAGLAPQAVLLPGRPDGLTRLRLGFPAERRFTELVIDPDDRIVAEASTDPKHLIRRSFVYPEANLRQS